MEVLTLQEVKESFNFDGSSRFEDLWVKANDIGKQLIEENSKDLETIKRTLTVLLNTKNGLYEHLAEIEILNSFNELPMYSKNMSII